MSIKTDIIAVSIAGVVLLAAGWYAKKKLTGVAAGAVAEIKNQWDTAQQAGSAVAGGTGHIIGDLIGVPRTNMSECERALIEGRSLDASFACPAMDYLRWMADGTMPMTPDFGVVGGW